MSRRIYLDNHATTRVDPRVLDRMLPFFTEEFANPGSVNHVFGRSIAEVVFEEQRATASFIHAVPEELVFTSGATESNNLALFGVCLHPRQKRRRVLTVATEHRSILDPLKKLERHGFEVIECPVMPMGHAQAGRVDLDRFANLLDEHIALVTVMLANNEIGVIQDLATIASICRTCDVWLHTDATQALGKLPIDVDAFDVDLMSFSAHKFYGPKGVGGLFVRNRQRMVRLDPQMVGGGHQWNRRSGTLNVPGIVGMSCALSICEREREVEGTKVRGLRNRLWNGLRRELSDVVLNGPRLEEDSLRLGNNLNCQFPGVEGQALMLQTPSLCCSSGSACTSSHPEPSHVLQGIGCNADEARSSLRFGLGRFNEAEEVDQAVGWLAEAYRKLKP